MDLSLMLPVLKTCNSFDTRESRPGLGRFRTVFFEMCAILWLTVIKKWANANCHYFQRL